MPPALLENAGLACVGEVSWGPAILTAARAHAIESARNPTGRPNSDVLRHFTGVKSSRRCGHRQIDFPAHFSAQEVALYQEPCRQLRSRLIDVSGPWWLNPCAQTELRTSITRLERFLATPLAAPVPVWDWVDSNLLPDDSLLVVARDDDFTYGLLGSRLFRLWWEQFTPTPSPASIVASFPFPWPPATLLSSLTRDQEERRLALARAARGGDPEQLNFAATTAYGWPVDLADSDLLANLAELNRQRAQAGW